MFLCSIFQGLPKSEQEGVLKIISANIATIFGKSQPDCEASYSDYSTVVGRKIEHLEALMENFKLGEAALKHQLPIGEADVSVFFFFSFEVPHIACSIEILCVSHSELEQ